MMGSVQNIGVVRFSVLARQLADEARRLGLRVPAFRSPPRLVDADRTIRRSASGSTVAVRRHGRPAEVIAADLIAGILVANDLTGAQADACRRRLESALAAAGSVAA
jgi:hypothetical protein